MVRATKKLLQRVGGSAVPDGDRSTTLLGDWYASALLWRPQQVILLVNEVTLLPVVMPLAPAATAAARIGEEIAAALAAYQAPRPMIDDELSRMRDCRFGPTANRSVVGVMNEFTRLAEVYRSTNPGHGLLDLGLRLAGTPCSPLYRSHGSPDRELQAFLRSAAP
jgi:hypothetical protein